MRCSLHEQKASCIFSNMSNFYTPRVRSKIKELKSKGITVGFEALLPIIMTGKAVQSQAWCIVHKAYCTVQVADHHEASLICTDWSVQGNQLGLNGPTMEYTMAWVGQRRYLQEPTWSVEQVKQFLVDPVLTRSLGDLYEIEWQIVSSCSFGFPDKRERMLIHGRHRHKVPHLHHTYYDLAHLFSRHTEITWRDFMVATEDDVEADYTWQSNRASKFADVDYVKKLLPTASKQEMALTKAEFDNYLGYLKKYPNCLYMTGQSHEKHPQRSSTTLMNTVIKNCGITMCGEAQRAITPEELLISQGLPIYQSLSA